MIYEKKQWILRHDWTEEEKEYIKIEYRYNRETFARLCREFKVTPDALRKVLSRLGLVKYIKPWSPKEIRFLRENYNKLPTVTLARILKRGEGAVHHQVIKLKLLKGDRVEWFTMSEVCEIFGVSYQWLHSRMNNGYKFDVRPFNPEVLPQNGGSYYISRESIRGFIRRYPEELNGHNVNWVVIVEILAGIKTEILSTREEDAEKEIKAKQEMVSAGGTIRMGSSRYTVAQA